ncbi:MAG TPA: YqaJ viral recombinase family protein [Candidatus Saccharimonadales bacterium]|jgi:hypothetical protein|nr:YqaJ viral recombinase family protein [Candidatus Saccharimonadales bacterium]
MGHITLHDVEQGSEAWHELRTGKYTGSNAYKLLGSFGATEYAQAIRNSFRGNFHTKRGHILENEAIELYEAIKTITVLRTGFVTNSKYPTCLYSPDGLAPAALLEVKCFDIPEHRKLIKGEIKLSILAQIHFGLLITEQPIAHLIAYNPSKELTAQEQFRIIEVKPNRNIQTNFKRILTAKEARHAIHT